MVGASRSAGRPKNPSPVKEVIEAVDAEPGKMSEARARKREGSKIDPGSTTVEGMKKEKEKQEKKEKKKPDLEIQLLDADDKPVKNEKVELTLKDGTKKTVTTDGDGVVTEKEVEGAVKFRLLDRYDNEWEYKKTEKLGGNGG